MSNEEGQVIPSDGAPSKDYKLLGALLQESCKLVCKDSLDFIALLDAN